MIHESTPKTLKKENHGGMEVTKQHRVLLINTIYLVNSVALCHIGKLSVSLCGEKRLVGVDSTIHLIPEIRRTYQIIDLGF